MQSGGTRCNRDGLRGLGTKHLAGRRGELAEHESRGIGRGGLEMLARSRERAT